MSTSFTFKFSQKADLRYRLAAIWAKETTFLGSIADQKLDTCETILAEVKPTLETAISELRYLENKLAENEKLIRRKQLASKKAKAERPALIAEYKDIERKVRDLEVCYLANKDEISFWQLNKKIAASIEQGETIFAIGTFLSLASNRNPYAKLWRKATGYNENDIIPDLCTWAKEKVLAYCLGYIAMAKANEDLCIDRFDWQRLERLATKHMPNLLSKQFAQISEFTQKQDYETWPSLAFRFSTVKNFSLCQDEENLGFEPAMRKIYAGKDANLLNAAIDTGTAIYSRWYAFPMIGCFSAIIAQLEKPAIPSKTNANPNARIDGLYSSVYDAYPNMDKQALKVASELYLNRDKEHVRKSLKAFNGKSTWDKDLSTYSSDYKWITDGHALYNIDAIKEESLARFTFAISKHKPNAQVILNKFTNTSYQNIRVLGTRRNSSDIGWYTYFTTDDNKIVVANYGYIKLLETFKMSVARLVYHSDGIFVALDHKGKVLAAIMGVKPENSTDKTDVLTSIAFDAVLSFYDQGNGNANHPSNKHLLASAKVA